MKLQEAKERYNMLKRELGDYVDNISIEYNEDCKYYLKITCGNDSMYMRK